MANFLKRVKRFFLGSAGSVSQRDPRKEFGFFSRGVREAFGSQLSSLLSDESGLFGQAVAAQRALPQILAREAAASTLGGQIAALEAARRAAGGRRGLAFGGAGAALAARGGAQAAGLANAARLSALAQGQQGLASLLAGRAGLEAQFRFMLPRLLAGLATAGLTGAVQPIKKPGKRGLFDFAQQLGQTAGSFQKLGGVAGLGKAILGI